MEFPLAPPSARPELLKISEVGSLREDARYQLRVVSDSTVEITDVSVVINGEEVACGVAGPPTSYTNKSGTTLRVYATTPAQQQLLAGGEAQILRLIYGFARIEVLLTLANDEVLKLETDDIPVLVRGDYEAESKRVGAMFDALFNTSPSGPLEWMLTGISSDYERFSIVEGGTTSSAPKSVSTFLQVTNHVLAEFEQQLSSFRAHVRSSIGEVPTRIPGNKLRVAGSREAFWVATHPDVLQRSRENAGIKVGNAFYMPRYVQTGLRTRVYDIYENRVIVAFLSACAQRLGRVCALVDLERERSKELEKILNPFVTEGYLLSSLLVADTSFRRADAVRQRANVLRKKAISLLHAYELAAPGVEPGKFAPPRRSKIFQEVAPYTRLYELIMQWCTAGDLDMRGSLLALRTARMDRLYEYYVLLVVLTKLEAAGYKPDSLDEQSIEVVEYSLARTSRFFRNERHVANKYVLKGDGGKVTLFYQPVFYGDKREENGVEYHRTTLDARGRESYYTPDFLLLFEGDGMRRAVVFDAKYRYSYGVMNATQSYSGPTDFENCLKKYVWETSSTHGPVDAMWLLCGRDDEVDTRYREGSSWASSSAYVRSGAMSLTPKGENLDALFEAIGIIARQTTQWDAEQSAQSENSPNVLPAMDELYRESATAEEELLEN
ncbi:MAG: DUF2357 domain-containing protein, partial [Coriobacteriales bacterium]|nr:DUF2357 domain-containing protein [Coriobacteriales bacterium]